ncbi:MAG: Clp protease ClpP, partial [Anaerostipes sp.]|nr:Clp protease ClpP [Anaerostipes sp.]
MYFSIVKNDKKAVVNIFSDIEQTEKSLPGEIRSMNVKEIHVHINSYGGEVAEGLAVYNALKDSKAKVITYCDGFAASIASVIFCAGEERVMQESSLLMIHNAWGFAQGNADEIIDYASTL